jgi:membrane associated rhomboid family serine protease
MRQYYSLQLVGICVIVYIFQSAYPVLTDNFVLASADVAAMPWTLVTAIFLHGSLMHLGYNMISLMLFGSILETIIGSRKFLVVFFASGILANIVSTQFYTASLGASGAIFGVMGVLTALRPRLVVWATGVPMPLAIAAGFWLLLDLLGVFYPSNVANMAHITGLAFGLGIGMTLLKQYGIKRTKRAKSFLNDKEFATWEDEHMKK